jgi:glycosyltransferase involved in cell wall biosynthesis
MWMQIADFPIRYMRQENKGKHVAFNLGVREAKGELFLPIDSDDACVSNTLERFIFHWNSIPSEKRGCFTGVCVHCMDQDGRLIGNLFPSNPTDSDILEIRFRYKVKGEKWGFNRTDVLKRFPFPENENMKFIPEGIVWNGIAKFYKMRFVNETLRVYYVKDFDESDQLSQSLDNITEIVSRKYAIGCALYYESFLNDSISWFRYAPREFFLSAISYARFSLHSGKMINEILKKVYTLKGKILVLFAIPTAKILYFCDSRNTFMVHRVRNNMKNLFKKISYT